MHGLKEALMRELKEYEERAQRSGGKMSPQDLEKIHMLTDTVKNIDKISMLEADDGYSETGYPGGSYRDGYSGRRGQRRDSMGRYSRDGGYNDRDGSSYGRGDGYSMDGEDSSQKMIRKLEDMVQELKRA